MKKILLSGLFTLFILISGNVAAQTAQQIAFVNSNSVLDVMPERIGASKKLTDLNRKYQDELQVMQNDYNKKYTDFISFQTSMAENIRLRRMQQLYELERELNEFMKVAQEDIQNQEKQMLDPLRQRVKEAITQIGIEHGFICIYDLANPTIAFVTPNATDITPQVMQKLGIKITEPTIGN